MVRSNFGAVRLPLLGAAVLASFAVSLSAQVVEKGRTYADLVATHPCNSGNSGRLARVTDAQSSSSIGGGGGLTQVWAVCNGVDTWTLTTIGGSGGGVSGLTTADGGTALADNAIVRGDGTTGVQGSTVTVEDSTGNLQWEGTTADAFEGNFTFADPTADWTWAWGAAGDLVGAGSLSIDNLRLDGNTISSTDTDGNIRLVPNGAGVVGIGAGTPNASYKLDVDAGANPYSGRFLTSGTNFLRIVGGYNADVGTRIDSSGSWFYGMMNGVFSGTGDLDFLIYDYSVPRAALALRDGTGILNIASVGQFAWGSVGANTASDTGLAREVAGIVRTSNGSTGLGWSYAEGKKALTADFTSQSATPANLSGLTVTLKAGRKYTFRMALRFSDSTAADGARFDFDGGDATATDFGVNCQVYDSALLVSSDTTALATDLVATTTTGASSIKCDGSFVVNAAGTFIPRAGQEAASGGTLTVETGSYLDVTDASFN